jgi:hypothetical protein
VPGPERVVFSAGLGLRLVRSSVADVVGATTGGGTVIPAPVTDGCASMIDACAVRVFWLVPV